VVLRYVITTVIFIYPGSVFSENEETNAVQAYLPNDWYVEGSICNLSNDPLLSIEDYDHEKKAMLSRLKHFFTNLSDDGWNGYGARPIEHASYSNAVEIVRATPNSVLRLWNVFPSPNGTISFEFKERKIAAMSVGNDDFSYIAIDDEGKSIQNQLNFNVGEATAALANMCTFLGYCQHES
jgi:hypothetical protein